MPRHASTEKIRLHTHCQLRCVQCGQDVQPHAQRTSGTCHRCGCFFDARPPMSYAQMEGLLPKPGPTESTPANWQHQLQVRLVERWILSGFLALIAIVLIATALHGD